MQEPEEVQSGMSAHENHEGTLSTTLRLIQGQGALLGSSAEPKSPANVSLTAQTDQSMISLPMLSPPNGSPGLYAPPLNKKQPASSTSSSSKSRHHERLSPKKGPDSTSKAARTAIKHLPGATQESNMAASVPFSSKSLKQQEALSSHTAAAEGSPFVNVYYGINQPSHLLHKVIYHEKTTVYELRMSLCRNGNNRPFLMSKNGITPLCPSSQEENVAKLTDCLSGNDSVVISPAPADGYHMHPLSTAAALLASAHAQSNGLDNLQLSALTRLLSSSFETKDTASPAPVRLDPVNKTSKKRRRGGGKDDHEDRAMAAVGILDSAINQCNTPPMSRKMKQKERKGMSAVTSQATVGTPSSANSGGCSSMVMSPSSSSKQGFPALEEEHWSTVSQPSSSTCPFALAPENVSTKSMFKPVDMAEHLGTATTILDSACQESSSRCSSSLQSPRSNSCCHYCGHAPRKSVVCVCTEEDCKQAYCLQCLTRHTKCMVDSDEMKKLVAICTSASTPLASCRGTPEHCMSEAGTLQLSQYSWTCFVCRKICCCTSGGRCNMEHRHCKRLRRRGRRTPVENVGCKRVDALDCDTALATCH